MIRLENYYDILGLEIDASFDDIKTKYRELAKILHPDNRVTGDKDKFQSLASAYQILSTPQRREKYDLVYKKYLKPDPIPEPPPPPKVPTRVLPSSRVIFPRKMADLAKIGLMKKGLRNQDRKKKTNTYFDMILRFKFDELDQMILAKIPLTVRRICPDCMGSDIHCLVCGGKGSYKSTRELVLSFPPEYAKTHKFLELELGKFRPDQFTHFKKQFLKIKLEVMSESNAKDL
jgi:DnaJ-class molecular chaperone